MPFKRFILEAEGNKCQKGHLKLETKYVKILKIKISLQFFLKFVISFPLSSNLNTRAIQSVWKQLDLEMEDLSWTRQNNNNKTFIKFSAESIYDF